jgi:hypothetical protein
MTLWQGPPGTGKTKTVVALLHRLVVAGKRVVVAAPSNKAVQVGVLSTSLQAASAATAVRRSCPHWMRTSLRSLPPPPPLTAAPPRSGPGPPQVVAKRMLEEAPSTAAVFIGVSSKIDDALKGYAPDQIKRELTRTLDTATKGVAGWVSSGLPGQKRKGKSVARKGVETGRDELTASLASLALTDESDELDHLPPRKAPHDTC